MRRKRAVRSAVADCERLAAQSDHEFGIGLLAGTPTHEGRDPELLSRWAAAAEEFGSRLAADDGAAPPERPPRLIETTGGLDPERLLLARYTSRPPAVELFTDTLAYAEELIDELDWRHWYPAGSVRAAALAHETAHCRLHRRTEKAALRQALDHTVLRVGRFRFAGHVAGADELAAHAYARAVCGLGRSPLLLTAALAHALQSRTAPAHALQSRTAPAHALQSRTAPQPVERREP
ncbi:hypothetical protein LHJ74_17830 [Streptomyces sp. N2-109]|uniref:Uncharacterized protein n=1 Tax=Streptomyces gossypii TaxID=2883101 RepID=A0ABT2JV11_9ACTN|nr:hypothetical protein [Streptomyces gossypii]MCT2591734.1 hypothetical protein [Streptomyces gossypii]